MPEIITRGSLPSEKVFTTSCDHCKTTFKFKQGEAVYHSDQRDGDYLSITCPLPGCGRAVWHSARGSYWDR